MHGEAEKLRIIHDQLTQPRFNITAVSCRIASKPSLSLSSSCQSRFAEGKRGGGRFPASICDPRPRSYGDGIGAFCYTPHQHWQGQRRPSQHKAQFYPLSPFLPLYVSRRHHPRTISFRAPIIKGTAGIGFGTEFI